MVRRFRLHGAAVVSFGLFACAVGEEGTSVPGVEARPQRPPSGAREDVTTIGSPAPSSLIPSEELPHPTELAGVQPSDLRVAGDESPGGRAEESAASSPSKRSCRSLSLGLVAGGIGSAHGMSWRNGQWRGPTPLGATLVARPGLAPLPQGFLAVMRGASDALTFSRFDGSSWAPASLVAMAHNALDEPHLMPDTVPPILVFQKSGGEDHRKFAITYWAGHNFTPPSLVAQGADISFGPRSPSAAVLGSQLTIAHAGDNGALYTRSQGVSWAASLAVPQASPKNDLPTAVTVLPGGALLVVYSSLEGSALSLKYTLRTGSRWSPPASLYDSGGSRAYSRDPLSLVTLDDGRALLVFRGDDTNMYFSLFEGAGTWTQPAPIASTPVRSVSPPSVAAVPCGGGAVVAFVEGSTTPTEIRISRFQGPGWSLPETVPALTGLAHVGIAAKSEISQPLSP